MPRRSLPSLQRVFLTAGLCLASAAAGPCLADVRLPRIFGNQMVVQRDMPVRVWGKADPGEQVTVTIGKNQAAASADQSGKWKVELPALTPGEPVEIKVSGKNTITLRDVLVGEVWICSGQSNMQWPVSLSTNAKKELADARHPQIRLFTVPMKTASHPEGDVDGYWKECTPETIPGFSAVAYFFGRELHKNLGVPVGLVNTSWGGTRIEPWTPPVGFRAVPAVASIADATEKLEKDYRAASVKAVEPMAKWLAQAQKAKAAGKRIPAPPDFPKDPFRANTTPTALYNAMIHPLVPFSIRGAIWYQGESNLADGLAYLDKMKALIAGWRTVWNEGDFPFYFVQLGSFNYGAASTMLPLIWEAQSKALSIPNTGMAVINDVSNVRDIHPRDKQDVGKRLALWALAKTYGRSGIVYTGPTYQSMDVEGSTIRLNFEHVGGGLVSRNGKPLDWFTIAGEDKKFVPADAKIEGKCVVVSSPKVAKPVAVRFAWDQSAEPNFANQEGLPASAFRTDRW